MNKLKGGLYVNSNLDYKNLPMSDEKQLRNAMENSLLEDQISQRDPTSINGNYYIEDADGKYGEYKQFDVNDLNKQINDIRVSDHTENIQLKKEKDKLEKTEDELKKKVRDIERQNSNYVERLNYNQRANNLETLLKKK